MRNDPSWNPSEPSRITNDVSAHFYANFDVELARGVSQIDEVHRLRYEVYCLDRPFEDPKQFPDGRERDDFDKRSVHGLVRHRATGATIASVRLVLSQPSAGQGSFPMEDHCTHALDSAASDALGAVPREQVAELSRLSVSRNFRRRRGEAESPTGASDLINYEDPQTDGQRTMPYITLGLFALIVRLSAEHEVTHWLAVMEPTLLRLLRRFGIAFSHVGDTVEYHGRRKPVFDEAAVVLDGIRRDRPDVWAFITDSGRYNPGVTYRAPQSEPIAQEYAEHHHHSGSRNRN